MDKKLIRKIKLSDGETYYLTCDTLKPEGSEYHITLPELSEDETLATESFVEDKINEYIIKLLDKEY